MYCLAKNDTLYEKITAKMAQPVPVYMEATGMCGSYRYVWKLPVCVEVTGMCGSYRYVLKLPICVEVTDICGSYPTR